jgi:hypothetical protein
MKSTELPSLEEFKYPIGKYQKPEKITKQFLDESISEIELFPRRLRKAVTKLDTTQLDAPYRPGGWTVLQLVHHCADSHMNSVIRFKLALTEEKPVIKPYFEDRWAELADSKICAAEISLQLLDGLHGRWITLLRSLTEEQLEKSFIHPEHGREIQLKEVIGMYAWHCNHHLAHITSLKQRNGWE